MKYKVLVGYKEKFSTRFVEAENEDAAVAKAVKQFITDYHVPEYDLCLVHGYIDSPLNEDVLRSQANYYRHN